MTRNHVSIIEHDAPASASVGRSRWDNFTSRNRIKCTRLRVVLVFLVNLVLFTSPLAAEDTVYLRGEKPGDAEIKAVGEIVDYTGQMLSIKPANGVLRNYHGNRVLRIESTWNSQQEAGDQAFAAGDYRTALQQYTQALNADQRTWVRRMLLAQLVWCYRNLGDYTTATERFIALVGSDPHTPYFDAIPLQWTSSETVDETKANTWMTQRGQPATQLIGASHLLFGNSNHPAATATVRELTRSADPRIAALATGQHWRTLLISAQATDLDRWGEIIEKMPEELQAGPYFVLGTTLARQGQSERAALALLRPPVLYPRQRSLAAESLLAAAGELAKLKQTDDATRLYREVIATYPGTKAGAAAQSRLEKKQ
jgi:tetratricopeptide (TPR) repeat protein